MNIGKIAVISMLAILGAGALGGGFYAGNIYIPDELAAGISDLLVIPENYATDDPAGYADWLTNADADDDPSYIKYYLWNLTNSEDYLTGSVPIFEEVGPYVYQTFSVKLNVTITATTMEYQTYDYSVFSADKSFTGASETDVIVNVNPAYMGVIGGAGSEAALVTGFVGPTIQGLLAGMQTDFTDGVKVQAAGLAMVDIMDGLTNDFAEGVIVQGMPQVLEGVQAGVTPEFHFAVNATTSAGLMSASWDGVAGGTTVDNANDAFFNDVGFQGTYGTPIKGVAEFWTASASFSNDTIEKLLHTGVPGLGVIGWFSDLATGLGVLGFLQAYEAAIDPLNTDLDNATLQAAYIAVQPQLDAAAGYLIKYLIENNTVVEGAYQGANAGETTFEGAENLFYAQWANSSVTTDLDLDGDGSSDDFELNDPSDISRTVAGILWDSTHPLGLSNDSGIIAWFGAALGDPTANAAIDTLGLSPAQEILIFQWLSTFKDGFATTQILASFAGLGIVTVEDIGIYHWGDGFITGGLALFELDPSVPAPIEFWNVTDSSMSFADAKALTTGTWNMSTTEGIGAILTYANASTGDATSLATINGLFGTTLTAGEVAELLTYIDYITNILALGALPITTWDDLAFYHWGNGTITSGLSLATLAPDLELPNVPEFWAWTSMTGSHMNLTLAQSKALLTGDNSLLNSTTVGMMLLSAAGLTTGDAATLGVFDFLLGASFSTAEYTMLLGYIQYMMEVYVADWVLAPVIAAGGGLIATKTVEEWLWEYDDPLLSFLKLNGIVDDAAWSLFPPHANDTDPAISVANTFKTGADDIANIKQYVLWQGKSEIPDRDDDPENGVWDHVETIVGTDATQFHPGVTSDEALKAWLSDLMRTIELVYLEDTEVEGIDLLRFVLADNVLGVDPAFDQTIKGLANMTIAKGVPMFLSKPHFLDTDASAITVTGMVPVRADHETVIDVEPTSGAVMNAAKRLQVSFQVGAGNYLTTGVGPTVRFLPLLWIEEGGSVTPSVATAFKDKVYSAQDLQQAAPFAGSVLGAILIYASIFIAVRSRKP